MLTLPSCRQEICYDHGGAIDVALDWECEWERDYGMNHSDGWDALATGIDYAGLRPSAASSVTMMVYPDEPQAPYSLFLSSTGGSVSSVASGSLLFYNDDTECVVINDVASFPDAVATTTGRSRSSLGVLHEGERTVNPPDVLFGAFVGNITPPGSHTTSALAVRMRPLVYTYIIDYVFDQGLELVSLARGALAGMAASVRMRDGHTDAGAATLLFDCQLTDFGARAVVTSFGVPSFDGHHYNDLAPEGTTDPSLPFTLNLEVLLKSGSMQSFEFDVASQMRNQPRGGYIKVGGIYVIDDNTQVDSGFDVDVDDWGDYEDVILPPYET